MRNGSPTLATLLAIGCLTGCQPATAPPTANQRPPAETAASQTPRGDLPPLVGAMQRGAQLIDLTHAFNEQTIYWPTAEGFRLTVDSDGVTDKGYYYSANSFQAAEHGGTHLDAPIHFFMNGETADQVPLSRLVGEAIIIDVSKKCASDPDYQITVDDLHAWEEHSGRQLVDVIVLLRTGFAQHWPDREKYLGTSERGAQAIAKLHFPGLHPDAALWLAEHRAPLAIGIDTASIDYGQSTHFQSHVRLFEQEIPVFENVALTDSLPAAGFTVIALPMKIEGGSGGPLRIIAVVQGSES